MYVISPIVVVRPRQMTPSKSSPTDPVESHIPRRIRAARATEGLSCEDMAETLGVSVQEIQNIEQGVSSISVRSLYHMAVALRRPIEYFFPGHVAARNVESALHARDPGDLFAEQVAELTHAFARIHPDPARDALIKVARTLADSEPTSDNDKI